MGDLELARWQERLDALSDPIVDFALEVGRQAGAPPSTVYHALLVSAMRLLLAGRAIELKAGAANKAVRVIDQLSTDVIGFRITMLRTIAAHFPDQFDKDARHQLEF